MHHPLKKLFLIIACVFSMQTGYADHILECPSVETLSTYNFGIALPYSYNKSAKLVNFVSVALEPGNYGRSGLVIHPVPVTFSADPEVKTRFLINQLVLETNKPVPYRISSNNTISMCLYSLPGKNKLTAFLFITDFEDNEAQIFASKSSKDTVNKAEQALKFLKYVSFPILE